MMRHLVNGNVGKPRFPKCLFQVSGLAQPGPQGAMPLS